MNIDLNQVVQNYGVLTLDYITVSNLRLPDLISDNISEFFKKHEINNVTKPQCVMQGYHISFYADFISEFACTETVGQELFENDKIDVLRWSNQTADMIPKIYTPINSLDLIRNQRLVVILWYLDGQSKQPQPIGQVNIKLHKVFTEQPDEQQSMNMTLANRVVGQV